MKKQLLLLCALFGYVGGASAIGNPFKGAVDVAKQASYSSARLSHIVNSSKAPVVVCVSTRQRESLGTSLKGGKQFFIIQPGQTLKLESAWGEIPWKDASNAEKGTWIATSEGILYLWDNFGINRNQGGVQRNVYSSLPDAQAAAKTQEQQGLASGGAIFYQFAAPGEVFGIEVTANPEGRIKKIPAS